MTKLLVEREILHPSLLDLVQLIIRHHHLDIMLHHARIGHLCHLQGHQKRQRDQLIKQNEIGSIAVPSIPGGINRLLLREDIPHLWAVGTHPLVQPSTHDASEGKKNQHVDE